MFFNFLKIPGSLLVFFLLILSCTRGQKIPEAGGKVLWPKVESAIKRDSVIEKKVAGLLSQMTLEQKIGQMVQVEIRSFSAEKMKKYHFGSVLNGGGSWPGSNKHASVAEWVALADSIWVAAMDSGSVKIPLLWGTDAVHGHNNKIGATIFPHNIGLGAANDPQLVKRIGGVTAREAAATGVDWTFAPTLAVVRDDRWGRTYESYSEDPEIVWAYAPEIVKGIQGNLDEEHILATPKHFIGDGGTKNGDDRGDNLSNEKSLRDIHGRGYFAALEAGAQTVMVSFSSWQGKNLHGHRYLLTEVLKGQMGFDGFVISDWNGIGRVKGCSNRDCPQAVNAGVDMFMLPFEIDWRSFIENLINHVKSGRVPMSRIHDAVTRILRVKCRAGLFDKPRPSKRALAGREELLGAQMHRALAREAVRKSLVLLKNKGGILPLSKDAHILVAGRGADNPAMQAGGWTITWQGTGNKPEEYKGFTTILEGIRQAAPQVEYDMAGSKADSSRHDVAIVVIGEMPYAESMGDIEGGRTLEYAKSAPEDLAVLETVRKAGVPIVTVFLSGRPLYTNREMNRSDAFVAAWLPGSEGGGVADVLFKDGQGVLPFDFTGRLSFSWPAGPCQAAVNRGDGNYRPLFSYGFGLSYGDTDTLGILPEEQAKGYGCTGLELYDLKIDKPLVILSGTERPEGMVWMGDPSNWHGIPGGEGAGLPNLSVQTVDDKSGVQGAGRRLKFKGDAYWLWSWESRDLELYLLSEFVLAFDILVHGAPDGSVEAKISCHYPCQGAVDITKAVKDIPLNTWREIRIPLGKFESVDFKKITAPFQMGVSGSADVTLANIRWEPEKP